ncbi:hypothetical protein GCM10023346_48590 [Arthrobacter gyeryongensis]|uniref:DNA-binding protein n=1 Tax=Arthrobacter gyeryongensis TaxID=1650592 RepID=A0ABP8V9C2_9MICC
MTAPVLGLAEAAKACGVSQSTLRRKRPELLELGAAQGPKGWSIPITALIALGLMDRTTVGTPESPAGRPSTADVAALMEPPAKSSMEALVEALKADLAEAEKRAAVAEAVAAERERIIAAQAQALRMLEAPKPNEGYTKEAAIERPTEETSSLFRASSDRQSGQNAHAKRPWLSRLLGEIRNG